MTEAVNSYGIVERPRPGGPEAPGAGHLVQQLPEAAGSEAAEPQEPERLRMKMRPVLTHQCAEGGKADTPGCPA